MTASRRIDHLVLAVHDLDAAAAWYERIGFQVGTRNRHPWGTENRLVQFASSFLELITVGEATDIPPHAPNFFSFGAFVRDFLRRREGLAMFVLDSTDAAGDAATFAEQGIGDFRPFDFERSGRRADGTPTRVAFSLAFAVDDRLPEAAFFVCQQHYPEAFWSPSLQRHPNGATGVTEVTLDVGDPAEVRRFLQSFTGTPPAEDGRRFVLAGRGQLRLATESGSNRFTGYQVGVPDLDAVAARLSAAGVQFRQASDRVTVASHHGFGARLAFELGR